MHRAAEWRDPATLPCSPNRFDEEAAENENPLAQGAVSASIRSFALVELLMQRGEFCFWAGVCVTVAALAACFLAKPLHAAPD